MHAIFYELFGSGKDLNSLQMSCRAVLVFFAAIVLLRISGRRSFGMRAPFDIIISILLGAVLSRAVVGASPFLPVMASSLVIVLLHRGLGWVNIHSKMISECVKGKKIVLFEEQHFHKSNMNRALVDEEDLKQALRKKASLEDFGKVRRMFMESDGQISVVKSDD